MSKEIYSVEVIYEDNHLIAFNKPNGILVQGDKTGDVPLLDYAKDYIKHKYNKPGAVFLNSVHRLDRPVSGTVLFARTSKALSRMNKLIAEREVSKYYYALVTELPTPMKGTLVDYLVKNKKSNRVKVVKKGDKEAKRAELSYEIAATINGIHLLKIDLKTGRPHQIRAQLSNLGSPIIGDRKYGANKRKYDYSIMLHSHSISFVHPVQDKKILIRSKCPSYKEWLQFKDYLKF